MATLTFHAKVLPLQYGFCVILAFSLCLFFSYFTHFATVTRTHCKLPEFFPTISAAIGDMMPEKVLFRYFMALTSGPRILTLLIIYHLFKEEGATWRFTPIFNRLAEIIDIGRVFTAGVWIYVGSGEDHFIHDIGFGSYILLTVLHQIVHITMFYNVKIKGRPRPHPADVNSYRWKMFYAIGHILLFFGSMYYFVEHRFHCRLYAFSKYAVFEWLVALFNIMYDVVFYKDLRNVSFPLVKEKET